MKAFKIIFATLAATAVLAGCAKEITPPSFENDKVNPEGSRVIAVSFAPQTKTELDGFQPKFVDNDSILISNGVAIDTCEVKVESEVATISTNLTGPLTAVYPYTAAGMNSGNPKQIDTVLVSTVQSGTFADANICMAENVTDKAVFENKTALFCITPGAGDTTRYVEVITAGPEIANTTSGKYTKKNKIHVATESADSVWVSILVPDGLTVGDLKFSDGTNEKAITTGAQAGEEIAAGTLYTVTNEGWAAPTPDVEYVVIGGRKWATKNLGADKETDYGDYYAWGATELAYNNLSSSTFTFVDARPFSYGGEGWSSEKGFADENTPYYDGSDLIKYTGPEPDGDGKLELESGDDVATAKLGPGWRMPTSKDFSDLGEACGGFDDYDVSTDPGKDTQVEKGIYWCTNYDGVAGALFCDGTNKLFLPATGYGDETTLNDVGNYGNYWSSTLGYDYYFYAHFLVFGFDGDAYLDRTNRYTGRSVRPVYDDSTPAGPTVEYVEIAADYDNDPNTANTTLKWYRQNLAITDSGNKKWKGENDTAVKVPGTNEDVIVGDYFQWAASYAGYGITDVAKQNPDSLLTYTAFTNTSCGDTKDEFTFIGSKQFDRANAPYKGSGYNYTKYTSSAETTLDPSDDVANIILGGNWHMPTSAEFDAMKKATYWAWDGKDRGYYVFKPGQGTNHIAGQRFSIADTDNKAEALLFFPAAGSGKNSDPDAVGSFGRYWSGTHSYTYSMSSGESLIFDAGNVYLQGNSRFYGFSVRPVSD